MNGFMRKLLTHIWDLYASRTLMVKWSNLCHAYLLDSQLRTQRKNPIKMVLGLKGLHSCSSPSNNSHWAMGIIDGIIFRNLIWHYSNSLVTIIFLKRILISKRWFYNNSSFSESASSYSNGFTEPWIYNGGEANFHEHNNVRTVLEFLLFSLI